MDYKQKYLKYKNKYIKLKGGVKDKYLPCEICSITKEIYISKYLSKDIFDKISIPITVDETPNNNRFKQDEYILLKKITNENEKINQNSSYHKGDQDSGGNFISSPKYIMLDKSIKDSIIFCFDGISKELRDYLNENVMQNIVELKCSFRLIGNGRHIDECMCFMPYGLNKFKVWFYYIRNVTIDDSDYKSKQSKQKYAPQNATKEDKEYCEEYNRLLKTLPEIKAHLISEQYDNLNSVSKNLYNLDYKIEDNNFVLFPIDINIELLKDLKISYKLKKIPIFNRTFIETDEKCNIFFSIDNPIDPEVNDIFNKEIIHVKSFKDEKKFIFYEKMLTIQYHNYGSKDIFSVNTGLSGGNMHCLVKNIY